MPAYIPPQLRQAPSSTSRIRPMEYVAPSDSPQWAPKPSRSISGSHHASHAPRSGSQPAQPQTPNGRSGTPTRRTATPILASPASGLRVRRAGTPIGGREVDEMDMVQSVSRSGGDGAEGDALKDWAMQERYRSHIGSKLDLHYKRFNTGPSSIPSDDAALELESLGSIVLLMRKLREGVIASERMDEFALQVFEMSARLAIMARNSAQTISALSGLVPGVYLAVAASEAGNDSAAGPSSGPRASGSQTSADSGDQLHSALESLTLRDQTPFEPSRSASTGETYAIRKAELASLLLLYHLCHTGSFELYRTTLQSLTAPRRRHLRRLYTIALDTPAPTTLPDAAEVPFISPDRLLIARLCARYLSPHSFDPVSFFRLAIAPTTEGSKRTISNGEMTVTPHQRAIMQWAVPSVRDRAWAVMRKAYLEVRIPWAGAWLGVPQLDASHAGAEDGWGGENPLDRKRREELESYVKKQGLVIETGTGRIKLR